MKPALLSIWLSLPMLGQITIIAGWQHPILGEQNLGNKIPTGLSAYEVRACNDDAVTQPVSERWIVAQVGAQLAVQSGEWIEQAVALYKAKGFWPTLGRVVGRIGSSLAGAGTGVMTMNPLIGFATKEAIDHLVDIGKDKEKVVPPAHWWRDASSTTQQIQPRDCGQALIIAVADDGKEKAIVIPIAAKIATVQSAQTEESQASTKASPAAEVPQYWVAMESSASAGIAVVSDIEEIIAEQDADAHAEETERRLRKMAGLPAQERSAQGAGQ